MGIIFDLDQTLIDTSSLESLRRQRKWSEVYARISHLVPYDGINDILYFLVRKNIPVGIVTNSPESYCRRVISSCGWKISATVCYHDVTRRKPHPESMQLILKKMGIGKSKVLSVGDRAMDIYASKAAGIPAVAALWGSSEREALLSAQPEFVANTVKDLERLIMKKGII